MLPVFSVMRLFGRSHLQQIAIIVQLRFVEFDHQRFFPVQDVVHDRNDEKGHEGGVEEAAGHHNGHAAAGAGHGVLAENQGTHGQNRGQRRHEDGAHTGLACDEQRFPLLKARNAQLIDVVHEHDAIVDHGAHEHQEANEAHDGQLFLADEQADEAAGEGQRDGKEDDEGAEQALELSHHDQVDEQQT